MGRQAHITRLALGRSPYGEPLRDEDGNFVVGPHAHDNDGPDYHQQFDARGHPQNSSTTSAIRRLRRAQNDVLATVGVVVRKGEERKTRWEKLGDEKRFDLICQENASGSHLKGQDRVYGVILPWCITSLRRRLMTLGPYYMSPVTRLLPKEYRLFSPQGLLISGLPEYLASGIPQAFRHYVCDPNVEGLANYVNPWREDRWCDSVSSFARWHIATTIMRCIELPLLVHGTLKSLFIVPSDSWIYWRSFVPFSALSPIQVPAIPLVFTTDSITTFTIDLVRSPIILYVVREYLQLQIGYRLYALFRQILTKPDRPDPISAKVADQTSYIEETSIAGIGHSWPGGNINNERNKRYYGPKSFMGALSIAFPPLYKLLNKLTKGRIARSRGRLTPLLDRQLRATIRDRYRYERLDLVPIPRRGSPEDIELQTRIVNTVFKSVNLDPFEELVDKTAWTRDVLGPKADILGIQHDPAQNFGADQEGSSQPSALPQSIVVNNEEIPDSVNSMLTEAFRVMPEFDAVVIQASDGPVIMFNSLRSIDPQSVEEMDNVHVIQAANTSSTTLMQAVPVAATNFNTGHQEESQAERTREPQAREPSPPPTPAPGITRAVSLVDPQLRSSPLQPPFRPVRRPTETDDSLAAISETLRAEAGTLQSPRPSLPSPILERNAESLRQTIENTPDPPLTPLKHRQYRVTLLSNHPADSLAWHASAIVTSLIMLPFEAMWLRSVTDWALQNPAMGRYIDPWWAARLGFGVAGQSINVMGLGVWFGGANDTSGRLKYIGSILLTLGLEGMLRGVCWGFGVWYVKRLRERFGWGQF